MNTIERLKTRCMGIVELEKAMQYKPASERGNFKLLIYRHYRTNATIPITINKLVMHCQKSADLTLYGKCSNSIYYFKDNKLLARIECSEFTQDILQKLKQNMPYLDILIMFTVKTDDHKSFNAFCRQDFLDLYKRIKKEYGSNFWQDNALQCFRLTCAGEIEVQVTKTEQILSYF